MSESHHNHHHHTTENIKVAFFLNLSFTVIELVGGLLTNSMAILSDALHDLGDSVSLGLAWYFQKISQKKSDLTYSYGYKRFSLLGAFINSLILSVGSIFILVEAVPRLFNPKQPDASGMIILAIIGVIVNGFAVLRLKKGKSINEKVVSLHLLEDVLGWLAVLIGSIVMYFFNLPVIDSLLSIGIAIFILLNVIKNIRQSIRIILQGVPDSVDIELVKNELKTFADISDVHDLHIWSVDGEYNVLTVHIVLHENMQQEKLTDLKQKIKSRLHDFNIQHVTIEFEMKDEMCELEKCC